MSEPEITITIEINDTSIDLTFQSQDEVDGFLSQGL